MKNVSFFLISAADWEANKNDVKTGKEKKNFFPFLFEDSCRSAISSPFYEDVGNELRKRKGETIFLFFKREIIFTVRCIGVTANKK